MRNGFGSFWLHSTEDPGSPRPRLENDVHADVVIIGAGYTGLWTAYWLKRHEPDLAVVVVEQDRVGYGASGRNGGWISGKTVGMRKNLVRDGRTREDALAMERRCFSAVAEILAVFDDAGMDIDAKAGGWMQFARSESQLARLEHHAREDQAWGLSTDEVRLLGAEETRERVNVSDAVGAYYSPFCARADPAKLAYGLGALAEASGVIIYENSRVESFDAGVCLTEHGSATGSMVVLATEAYTARLPGRRRQILPMFSSMIVTEPLPDDAWEEIGWRNGECLSAAQHMYVYAQRTRDGRIALGGRGRPYAWGSGTDRNGVLDAGTIRQLQAATQGLFPQVPMTFDHAWCGVLGVPRDWSPFIDVDRARRLTMVGGYVGQGVTAAYLAGRTVADLLTEQASELMTSTWVRPVPRNWEPEPLRWIGSNAVQKLYQLADRDERRRDRPRTSAFGTLGNVISGR